ncbi:MAG: 6-phosphofructokinase [Oscillospiraceae bacterium]|jgi:6-phosphofructokinase
MAAKKVALLTSGGDCPGLNATMRGIGKALYQNIKNVEVYGFLGGFPGMIAGNYAKLSPRDFSGILTHGGTILGSGRQPFKTMKVIGDDGVDKVANMKKIYDDLGLDCLMILGGNGTHKTANLLANEGMNVIGLPKTIDNDIYGTDMCFGFQTALEVATDAIDRVHSTAESHNRCMIVQLMGNKAGWLTLYSGIAGGADIILIPEIPFEMENVIKAVNIRRKNGHNFTIIAVAEGAMTKDEAKLKEKDRIAARRGNGYRNVAELIEGALVKEGIETRTLVPGYMQRGGSPCAYDRFLCTKFGVYAANLFDEGVFGVTVALKNNEVTHNLLSSVAGKTKFVPKDDQSVKLAKTMGITFGDKTPGDTYKK